MSMILIQRQVLSSSAASVTFSNIPQNYKTLRILYSTRGNPNQTATGFSLTFNGSSSGYSERLLYGTGSSALSANRTGSSIEWSGLSTAATSTSNTFSNGLIEIPNYTSSANKVVLSDAVDENNATAANQYLNAALWSNSATITSMVFTPVGGFNFVANSSFSLYGIL